MSLCFPICEAWAVIVSVSKDYHEEETINLKCLAQCWAQQKRSHVTAVTTMISVAQGGKSPRGRVWEHNILAVRASFLSPFLYFKLCVCSGYSAKVDGFWRLVWKFKEGTHSEFLGQ